MNDQDLIIRPAVRDDCTVIVDFIQAIAAYEKLSDEVIADPATIEQSLFADGSNVHALLAELNSTTVGFAVYFFNFSTFIGRPGLYLEDIFVNEQHRHLGIGRALFARMVEIARNTGCQRMDWSVLKWNTPALDFYQKAGAVAMDEWVTMRMDNAAIQRFN